MQMGKNFKIAPKQDSEIWANIYALTCWFVGSISLQQTGDGRLSAAK